MTDFNFNNNDAVYFVPLGGCGEFGINLNLFCYQDQWLMVDLGMGFADDKLPGIDIILPDPKFIEQRKDKLLGLVITHAHEDHIGAIVHLWPRLRCPIYATPFTAAVIQNKLREGGLESQAKITIIPLQHRWQMGPFDLQFVNVAHSIPEPNLLVIRTPVGAIVHTGDWKLDPAPVDGSVTDIEELKKIGQEGVLALLGDSTNAATPGRSGSEGDLQKSFIDIFAKYQGVRIAVTSFASNIARLNSIYTAAETVGRVVGVAGRSLHRMNEAARKTGYLKNMKPFVGEGETRFVERGELVLVLTGSQGEPQAAMSRVASDSHPQVDLSAGDVVIFSARAIPGNEKDIARVQTNLRARGINVVTDNDEFVHVSGHPAHDDIVDLLQWLKPNIVLPVHGEVYQLQAHAKIAETLQMPSLSPHDGNIIEITKSGATIVGEVFHGLLCIDGRKIVPVGDDAIRGRVKIAETGMIMVSVVMDRDGTLVADPSVSTMGIFTTDAQAAGEEQLVEEVIAAVEQLDDRAVRRDDAVEKAAHIAVRKLINKTHGRKPQADVHVVRVG